MAANKRKILEAARKYAQKGARDRALKEYEKLLALDPRDAKLRLEIGDAYRRWGQLDDAIGTYIKVAQHYMAEGFDARAVAVFKQIHNLDPERWSTYEPLAELYQRMGLSSEAIQTLQSAADGYHRAGQRREALGLLRKMAAIDPTNITSRLKVADLLRQEGLAAEAITEYESAVDELEGQGEVEQAATALERVLELEPDRLSALARLSRSLLALNQVDRAEPFVKRLLDAEPDVPEHYETLAEIHRVQHRGDELAMVYRRLAELYRRRGDEDRAREITQRFVAPAALSASDAALDGDSLLDGGMKGDVSQFLEDADVGPDTLLDEDLLDPEPPPAMSLAEETVLHRADEEAPPSPAPPSGDPEQLLAEACVYLRYGKRDQAIENLEAIVARDERHRQALEKLGEALAEGDETERAVQVWLRAAAIAQEDGDGVALDVLRDRIAALDQAAAATLAPSTEPDEEYLEISQPVAPAGPDVSLDLERPQDAEPPDDIEIEIDTGLDDEPLDVGHPEAGAAPAAASEPEDGGGAASGASSSTSQQVLEELEEAEFYLQQGMLGEAEAIYTRLQEVAPHHPQVLVRLGELAAVRGDDPGATADRLGPGAAAGEPDAQIEGPTPEEIPDDLSDWTDDFSESAGLAAAPREPELTGEITSELSSPEVEAPDPGDTGTIAPAPDEVADELGADASEAAAGGFDLAAEIHTVLDGDADPASSTLSGGESDSFAAIFREFKEGVSRQLTEGDHEAHYDLGIAYREMGLFDDALSEFRAALGSPDRRLDCMHMMGQCALELGRADQAVAHLEQALLTGDLADEQQLAVRFDLGRAFEVLGDPQRAREAWEVVLAIEPSFADVEERLEALANDAKPDGPVPTEADFESFDDVVEEAVRDAGPAEPAPEPVSPPEKPRRRKRKKISFV